MKKPKFKTLVVSTTTHTALKEMCDEKGTKMLREADDMISYFLAAHRAQMRKGPKLNRKAKGQ